MIDEDDDGEFSDPNDYQPSKNEGVTFNQVILQQIRRCVEQGSRAMTAGFTKQVQTKDGFKDVYVDDQRELYINCIKSFYDVMIPYFDDEFKKDKQVFIDKLKSVETFTLDLLEKKREWAERNGHNKLKEQFEFNIATKHVDSDSFEAKKAFDLTIDIYRDLYQALIKLYVRVVGEGADIND